MLTQARNHDERGFTLIEVVISSGIILTIISLFAVFLGSVSSVQNSMNQQRVANRVLADQVEVASAINFDNLAMAAAVGEPTECVYPDGIRRSSRAIKPGPELRTVDGVKVSVVRTVVWAHSGDPVATTTNEALGVTYCADRAEPKEITITVSWQDGNYTRTSEITLLRSKWAEAQDSTRPSSGQNQLLEFAAPSTSSSTGWCAATEGSTGVTAVSEADIILATFPDTGDAICGFLITGLTPGTLYTAVMEVSSPPDGTPVELEVVGHGRSGQAPADNAWHTLTYTWQATEASRVVGAATVEGLERPTGSLVRIKELTIYSN
jgi:Tfp pilus assembly protein PilV